MTERRLPKEAPDRDELSRMARLLPGGLRDLVASRGRHWRSLGVDAEALTEDEVLERLLEDPLSLRRPLLWLEDRILLGYAAGIYKDLPARAD